MYLRLNYKNKIIKQYMYLGFSTNQIILLLKCYANVIRNCGVNGAMVMDIDMDMLRTKVRIADLTCVG